MNQFIIFSECSATNSFKKLNLQEFSDGNFSLHVNFNQKNMTKNLQFFY